ncbi:hypothetical protein [Phytomonospora endophytica]|uniref:Uncharacterized protein n=1 Tax=Phytomonospora endophytica TaxID=714109 RepID=A0A841FPN5_9ACTN|nr:hypothetical protein [Phytomonospora endophytica]MBB6035512.1 hypothetical protein [Phytomonospora endophytica]GIG63735.1 hypothetical protein Pen01_00300 [Phytomonospora endophytica]
MSRFLSNRKQLRAERAHQRALNRAAAQVSSRSVRDEILKARTYAGM